MTYNNLHDRMKGSYESAYRIYLPRRIPVIIRCDMKAGHTFTRGLKKPFDKIFMESMQLTAQKLVKEIEGCVLAYTQSDEISLLLKNNQTIKTEPWFCNNLNKMVSISASMATAYFNHFFSIKAQEYIDKTKKNTVGSLQEDKYVETLISKKDKYALFDSRAFVIPEDEVNNYFLDRQNDATRNSISACAQAILGKRKSMNHNTKELQDIMFKEANFNWNDLSIPEKRGTCVIYNDVVVTGKDGQPINRRKAVIDYNIPIFSQNPNYINNIVAIS